MLKLFAEELSLILRAEEEALSLRARYGPRAEAICRAAIVVAGGDDERARLRNVARALRWAT